MGGKGLAQQKSRLDIEVAVEKAGDGTSIAYICQ